MKISLIAAAGDGNNAIGFEGRIPWRLPADFKRFKELTLGHPVVMGRKTFESIGKPLPGRANIVIARGLDFHPEGCRVAHSFDEAVALAGDAGEIFVIGGEQIYRLAFPQAQKIYLTRIHGTFEGDAFFPDIKESEWRLVSSEPHEKNAQNPFAYTFCVYERR